MDRQLLIICFLTFIIHVVGTLAYAVRIAGIRTRRIAVSFALFNILVLVSRTSNSFQGPFLAKRIESSLKTASTSPTLSDFRWLLLTATIATVAGAVLIPTFQRLFSGAVRHFQVHRSMPSLLMRMFTRGSFAYVRDKVCVPSSRNVTRLTAGVGVSSSVILLNVVAMSLWTLGVFASLYAGYLKPELRVTCSNLSSVVNGLATIMMFVFIDPQVSVMTDDVIEGRVTDGKFRRAVTSLVGARLAGTVLAQFLLVPAATIIIRIAEAI
jgi:hypothetical protein